MNSLEQKKDAIFIAKIIIIINYYIFYFILFWSFSGKAGGLKISPLGRDSVLPGQSDILENECCNFWIKV